MADRIFPTGFSTLALTAACTFLMDDGSANGKAALSALPAVFGYATSSTDNAAVRFDGTTGGTQNSGVIIDDSNNVTGVVALTNTGLMTVDLGTGSLPAVTAANVFRMAQADATPVRSEVFGFGANGWTFRGRIAAGTRASPTAVADASNFYSFNANGYDGSAWADAGAFNLKSDGLWSGSNHGTYFQWQGASNGATSVVEWMTLRNAILTVPGTTVSTLITNGAFVVGGGAGFSGQVNAQNLANRYANGSYWTGSAFAGGNSPLTDSTTVTAWVRTVNTNAGGYDAGFAAYAATTTGVIKPVWLMGAVGENSWTNGTVNTQISTWYLLTRDNADAMIQRMSITSAGVATFAGDVAIASGKALQLGNAYVNTPQVPTGYIVIKDSTGTAYKVSCNA